MKSPEGVSQWKEYGKKYGYWKYFKKEELDKVNKILDQALEQIHGGGNGRRLLIHAKNKINKLYENKTKKR